MLILLIALSVMITATTAAPTRVEFEGIPLPEGYELDVEETERAKDKPETKIPEREPTGSEEGLEEDDESTDPLERAAAELRRLSEQMLDHIADVPENHRELTEGAFFKGPGSWEKACEFYTARTEAQSISVIVAEEQGLKTAQYLWEFPGDEDERVGQILVIDVYEMKGIAINVSSGEMADWTRRTAELTKRMNDITNGLSDALQYAADELGRDLEETKSKDGEEIPEHPEGEE